MLYGLTSFLPESGLSVYDILEFTIRIVLSGMMGLLIGLERTKRLKEAGIRTHFIVASASAVFMILSKYCFLDLEGIAGDRGADPARIAAQVVSGVSFLGAGVIFNHGRTVKGLTTAAGLWATSAVGMAVGAGCYWVGIAETACVVTIQLLLHRFPMGNDALSLQKITINMEDTPEMHAAFNQLVRDHHGQIMESDISMEDGRINLQVMLRVEEKISYEASVEFLRQHEGVSRISV